MTFSISAKIQDGGRKLEKSKLFEGATGVACITLGIRNLLKITLSLTVYAINDIFHFRHNSRWQPKFEKVKHFRGPGGVILSILGIQNLPEISLSLMVFEINGILHLCG